MSRGEGKRRIAGLQLWQEYSWLFRRMKEQIIM